MRLRVTKRFSESDRKRTGLSPGVELDSPWPHERGGGARWVHCPAVPTKTAEGFVMRSDGWCVLEAHEYEEIGCNI